MSKKNIISIFSLLLILISCNDLQGLFSNEPEPILLNNLNCEEIKLLGVRTGGPFPKIIYKVNNVKEVSRSAERLECFAEEIYMQDIKTLDLVGGILENLPVDGSVIVKGRFHVEHRDKQVFYYFQEKLFGNVTEKTLIK